MAQRKKGGGLGNAPPARACGSSSKAGKLPLASPADVDELSNGYDEFMPLVKGRNENDSSGAEAILMRQMGLEGAENAADEEDDRSSTQGGSQDSESDADGERDGSENEDSDSDAEEARTAWGRRTKDFYGESSSAESSDDEEGLQLRVAEAVRVTEVEDVKGMKEEHFGADPRILEGLRKLLDLQGKAMPADAATEKKEHVAKCDQGVLWQARLDAEVDAILDGFSTSTEQQQLKQQASTEGLEADLQRLVASAHPELEGLLQELREALVEVKEKVSPLVDLAHSRRKGRAPEMQGGRLFGFKGVAFCLAFPQCLQGLSLFDTKNQLLLSYLSYLSYYVLLKAHGIPIASHPVVERLIESRLLLQKIRPIEATLKPQLDKLFQLAKEGSAGTSSTARARPEAFAAIGASDEEAEEFSSGGEDDADEEESGSTVEDEKATRTYKAPKLLAMEYTGDRLPARMRAARELQRAAARLQKSELVRSVREMAGDAPEEIGIERWLAAKAHGAAVREAGFAGASRFENDDEELQMMKLSLSKRERKAQAAERAAFERRSATALGYTVEDLAMFADQPISLEEDAFDSTAGPLRRGRFKGALSHYLNAAKQAADEAAKVQKANAEKLVLARQPNLQHLSRRSKDTGRPTPRISTGDEGDEEFEAMAGEARRKKAEKKKRLQDKAKQFLLELEEEVCGQRGVTREIEKNRGLTRKRKKFEGNARVHNRLKFQQKAKKLKSICPDVRAVEDRSYEGETTGLRANLKKSRTLH